MVLIYWRHDQATIVRPLHYRQRPADRFVGAPNVGVDNPPICRPRGSATLCGSPMLPSVTGGMTFKQPIAHIRPRLPVLASANYIRRKERGGGSCTNSLTSSTSRLSVMSANRTSTKGCCRLNAAPRWYFNVTIRPIAERFRFPSALY